MIQESFPPTNLEFSNDTKPIYCDGCKNDNKKVLASCYCPSCKVHFCIQCDSFHDNHPLFKNHARNPVNQKILKKKPKQKNTVVVPTCNIHQEKIGLYCFDCLTLICFNCAFSKSHQGHNIKPIQEAAEILPKLQDKVNLSQKLEELLKKKKNQKLLVNEEITKKQNDQEVIMEKTKVRFQKLIQQMKEKSTEMLSHITKYHERQNEILKEEIEKINLQMETLQSSLKNSEKNYQILEQTQDYNWYEYLDAFSQLKKIELFLDSPQKTNDKIMLKRFEGQLVYTNVEKNISKIRFIKPFQIEKTIINIPKIIFRDHLFFISLILKNEQNQCVNIDNIENFFKLNFILNEKKNKNDNKKKKKQGGEKEENQEKKIKKESVNENEKVENEKEEKVYLVPKFTKQLSEKENKKKETGKEKGKGKENENENENEKGKGKGKGREEEGNSVVGSYYEYTSKFKLKHTGFYDVSLKIHQQKVFKPSIVQVIEFETDVWNYSEKGSAISLYNKNKTAKCNLKDKGERGRLTIKGTTILNKGIHCFRIQIDNLVGPLDIGVMPSRATGFPFKFGWVYDVHKGTKLHMQVPDGKYGEGCKNGDIITVIVNIDDHTLSFWKNETYFGVAFNEISSRIVLAISLSKNNKVTIL
ncbi:e3 ubiquitin-protein ligase trim [Anaeramoeba flamelloides]|uniref:E3 ubiquitin-protein ligase trim n=1 Tax=Anaeramoeba flamelloides TaxID=1746091 RepID=A0AAV8A6Q2_9EUKA|nr:e3 ubiquitin-protein ligase trim [Anaeramoeba flamelloides]